MKSNGVMRLASIALGVTVGVSAAIPAFAAVTGTVYGGGGGGAIYTPPPAPVVASNPPGPTHFGDVPSTFWASGAISTVSKAGIMIGVGGGNFAPNATTTGAEWVTMIIRFIGQASNATSQHGNAGGGPSWAQGFLLQAKADGLISSGQGTSQPITRLQAFIILAKAEKLQPVYGVQMPFTDLSGISSTDLFELEALYKAGMIQGMTSTQLGPNQTLTRAQAATLFVRMLGQ